MCRSIKSLRRADRPATDEDVRAAALQFVRKLSGYRVPSRANAEAFEMAVSEIAQASRRLLDALAARQTGDAHSTPRPAPTTPRTSAPRPGR